jgi:hypothetical protein
MSHQPKSVSPEGFSIKLEIVPEDPHNADLALIDAIGRDTSDTLRRDGCTIEPIYTGQRGGFLVDVLIPTLTAIWAQKDVILADGSALVTILMPVVLIIKHLLDVQEKRLGKESMQQSAIKITVEIDGEPISVEAPDLQTADAAMKLARRFQSQHPTVSKKATKDSKLKIRARVSKRHLRRSHN